MAYKQFAAGEEALAADVNSYLMAQTVARFANAAARTAAIAAPVLNQATMLDTTPGTVDYWNGTAWLPSGPGAELAYNQITASVTVTTSYTPIIEGTTRTYDGLPVMVEFCAPSVTTPTGGALEIFLFDGATNLGYMGDLAGPGGGVIRATSYCRQRLTPTVGSHNYRALGIVSSNTGVVQAGVGAGFVPLPAWLRITRA